MLDNKYEFWLNDESTGEFLIKGRIEYSEDTYECWAGFWNILKWAWIQYFAVFIVVNFILKRFQTLVYKTRLFESMVVIPWVK